MFRTSYSTRGWRSIVFLAFGLVAVLFAIGFCFAPEKPWHLILLICVFFIFGIICMCYGSWSAWKPTIYALEVYNGKIAWTSNGKANGEVAVKEIDEIRWDTGSGDFPSELWLLKTNGERENIVGFLGGSEETGDFLDHLELNFPTLKISRP
jgi:hypothetical protein